jgi:aquaporin Z
VTATETARTRRAHLLAEVAGTFALVFAGTGAAVADAAYDGCVTHVGISLTYGLIVLAMVYAFGETSGAHINPAVTLGFFFAGRFEGRRVLPYVSAQCVGAIAASGAVALLFPADPMMGATLPNAGLWQSFVLEILLTFVLMLVILKVSSGSRETGVMAGVAVGSTVAVAALFAGPLSGASMNPARSLGPAVFSGNLDTFPLYVVAPAIGAWLAVPAARLMSVGDDS